MLVNMVLWVGLAIANPTKSSYYVGLQKSSNPTYAAYSDQ
jgi:hypothetical protein